MCAEQWYIPQELLPCGGDPASLGWLPGGKAERRKYFLKKNYDQQEMITYSAPVVSEPAARESMAMITGTSDSLPHFLTFKQEKATFEIHFFQCELLQHAPTCQWTDNSVYSHSPLSTPSYQSSKDAFVAFILQIQLSHGPSHPPAVSTDIRSNTKPFLLFCQTGIILLSR